MIKIKGKDIAEKLLAEIKNSLSLVNKPLLTIVLVGEDEGSKVYVERKRLAAEQVGVTVEIIKLANNATKNEVILALECAVATSAGIILQLPLPDELRSFTEEIIASIPVIKDVDCLRLETLQAAAERRINWLPPIAEAIDAVVKEVGVNLGDKKICLVGRGKVTGLPLSVIYQSRGYKVTAVDERTNNIGQIIKESDVVISATGNAHLINGDMISDGTLIIDAGFARKDGKIVGDVDNQTLEGKNVTLCPSPGGIGPITVAALLLNVVKANK